MITSFGRRDTTLACSQVAVNLCHVPGSSLLHVSIEFVQHPGSKQQDKKAK